MDLKYKFSAKEYSTLCGITPSALRKRRLSGKLEGQFIKKGSEYFYSSQESRPSKQGQIHGACFTFKDQKAQCP